LKYGIAFSGMLSIIHSALCSGLSSIFLLMDRSNEMTILDIDDVQVVIEYSLARIESE
jgi:hypothetical protein